MNTPHANLLLDLGTLVKEAALAAQSEANSGVSDLFGQGRAFAWYEIVSLLQQQAAAFELPLSELGLEGFDAERDLLDQSKGGTSRG